MSKIRDSATCWKEHNYFKINPQSVTEKCELCSFCGRSFPNKTTRKAHENNQHIKAFKCEECGKDFGTKMMVKRHILELHSQIQMRYLNYIK